MKPLMPPTAFPPSPMAQKERPDLIILDLGLPAGDGFVVLERLQQNANLSCIPVIVLTARDPQSSREAIAARRRRRIFPEAGGQQPPVERHSHHPGHGLAGNGSVGDLRKTAWFEALASSRADDKTLDDMPMTQDYRHAGCRKHPEIFRRALEVLRCGVVLYWTASARSSFGTMARKALPATCGMRSSGIPREPISWRNATTPAACTAARPAR